MAFVLLYAAGITDACARKETSVDELIALREHARAVLQGQGDLKGALERLEREIEQRQKGK